MAISELGFNRPSYDEILDDMESRTKQLFGETIDTSDLSALGKFIRIIAKDIDTLYQLLEGVYYSRFPNTASGKSLERLCTFAGISRNSATAARYSVTFTGTAGATIEAGYEVSDEDQSVLYYTEDDYVIGSGGTVTGYVVCDETGTEGNVTPTDINTIVNPSADVESVIGVELITEGDDGESDDELRQRFAKAITGAGSGTAEAIKGAVMRVSGVDDCTVIEDTTNCQFKCVVAFDDTEATKALIAQAIFEKKPVGVKTFGTVSVGVEGEDGETHTVYFDTTAKKYIGIQFVLETNNYFEDDGAEQIKAKIINALSLYSNGQPLYTSSLYSLINITGVVSVNDLAVVNYTAVASPTGNPSTSGYFELTNGVYTASSDTTVASGKTYYTRQAQTGKINVDDSEVVRAVADSIMIFAEVASPTGNPTTNEYYEKSGNFYVLSADTSVNSNKTYYTLLHETEE